MQMLRTTSAIVVVTPGHTWKILTLSFTYNCKRSWGTTDNQGPQQDFAGPVPFEKLT